MENKTADEVEAELMKRDEAAQKAILRVIKYKRDLAQRMRDDAEDLEKQARRIEQDTKACRWWALEGVLENDEIESLCEVSPIDLLAQSFT